MSHYLVYRHSKGHNYPDTHTTEYATFFHTWGIYEGEGQPFRSLAKARAFARKMYRPTGIVREDSCGDRSYFYT